MADTEKVYDDLIIINLYTKYLYIRNIFVVQQAIIVMFISENDPYLSTPFLFVITLLAIHSWNFMLNWREQI